MSLYTIQLIAFDYQDVNAESAEVRENGAAVFYVQEPPAGSGTASGPRVVAAFATGMWRKFSEQMEVDGRRMTDAK